MAIKPILFNTEMVRAILDGRKTCTRRLPNKRVLEDYFSYEAWAMSVATDECKKMTEKHFYEQYPPYQPGDILYVRETWCDDRPFTHDDTPGQYFYRADTMYPRKGDYVYMNVKWRPSIHMPKEAARIWLKVTDVRVERLQKITEDGVWDEGFRFKPPCLTRVSADGHTCDLDGPCTSSIKYCDMTMGELFGRELWNSTIKKSDLDRYGWNANPWVWVIEFERCEKPEIN